MQEYYFLFALAFVWTLAATIQDIKKREVANWLNFSLIAFALGYRAFYSIITKDVYFFLWGLAGALIFFGLANLLYYARAFAGGDAKLLIGFGAIIPFDSIKTIVPESILFILLLFLVGAVYSLLYSILLVVKNKKVFLKEYPIRFNSIKLPFFICVIATISFALSDKTRIGSLIAGFTSLILLVYAYTKSLDRCMLKQYLPSKLTEGDWLEYDVRLNKSTLIKKTVHGLTIQDIRKLRKANKKVYIKEGIPFVPAFLITLLIMVLVVLIQQASLVEIFLRFFSLG
jgi:Flp pilus assembly protein protease CpaA